MVGKLTISGCVLEANCLMMSVRTSSLKGNSFTEPGWMKVAITRMHSFWKGLFKEIVGALTNVGFAGVA